MADAREHSGLIISTNKTFNTDKKNKCKMDTHTMALTFITFIKDYQPEVMNAYAGPHAGDPILAEEIERLVAEMTETVKKFPTLFSYTAHINYKGENIAVTLI